MRPQASISSFKAYTCLRKGLSTPSDASTGAIQSQLDIGSCLALNRENPPDAS